jgi:hypothetical protein
LNCAYFRFLKLFKKLQILLQILEMAFTRLDLREAKARPLHPSYHEAVLSTVCGQFNLYMMKNERKRKKHGRKKELRLMKGS